MSIAQILAVIFALLAAWAWMKSAFLSLPLDLVPLALKRAMVDDALRSIGAQRRL